MTWLFLGKEVLKPYITRVPSMCVHVFGK